MTKDELIKYLETQVHKWERLALKYGTTDGFGQYGYGDALKDAAGDLQILILQATATASTDGKE